MPAYLGLAMTLLVAGAGMAGLFALHRLSAVANNPLISKPFTSGWIPEQHALSRYHARYYPVTLIFLAFDVEMLFMYPWAVVVVPAGGIGRDRDVCVPWRADGRRGVGLAGRGV